jgi:choline dehydrogenase-like flavoprotein
MAIIDNGKFHDVSAFNTDFCVIGAGAAGIITALELSSSGNRVLLLESGGHSLDDAAADLSEGDIVGLPFTGLTAGRARALGGATRLWYGQCIRLEDIDYERRDWVPHSGWPLGPADLEPYFERAETYLNLSEPVYDSRVWKRFGISPPSFNTALVEPRFTIYTPQPDFSRAFGVRLAQIPNVTVLLNASVTAIGTRDGGTRVDHVEIRDPAGRASLVTASTVVLAAGGIENARLLLVSNDVATAGLGNGRDLVGRFFQDHPNGITAHLKTSKPDAIHRVFRQFYRGGCKYWPKLKLSDTEQRQLGVLNAIAHPTYIYSKNSPTQRIKRLLQALSKRRLTADMVRDLSGLVPHLPILVREGFSWLATGGTPMLPTDAIALQCYIEQAPNHDSRVMLSSERDRFGVPRAKVDWRVSDLDRRTIQAMSRSVGQEFQRLGLADYAELEWVAEPGSPMAGRLNDAFHHAGTTRMSTSPHDGVVDINCGVHGVRGLYVAGSSVFPTSGYANPTLTILALSIRLADHLKEMHRRDGYPSSIGLNEPIAEQFC